MFLYK